MFAPINENSIMIIEKMKKEVIDLKTKKGFTLIELLIVIAIIAILGSATVLVLNPVELMRQGRDGTRINDMDTLRNAVNNYLVNATAPSLGSCTAGGRCTANPGTGPFVNTTCAYTAGATNVTGTGWVDINFGTASPIAALPVDPVNSGTNIYAYMCETTNRTFEFDTKLESTKYATEMTTDGGNQAAWYEIGTAAGLAL